MRQAIVTRYAGPTDHRGSRVTASSQAGRVTVAWDHALDVDANHVEAARKLAHKLGWADRDGVIRLVGGGMPDGKGYAFVVLDSADVAALASGPEQATGGAGHE